MIRERRTVSVDPPDGLPSALRRVGERLYPIAFVPPGGDVDAEVILPGGVVRKGDVPRFDASTARISIESSHVELADDLVVPKPFRGMRSTDEAGAVDGLELGRHERALATGASGVVWCAQESGGIASFRTAVLPSLPEHARLRDAFRPGRTLTLLPLLAFLDRLTGAEAPRLPAAIVIDDPNLHSGRYGFLDYERIVAESARTPLHVALAVIPLDLWHAARDVVRLLDRPRAALSTLVHGNNHTRRELGQSMTDEAGIAVLTQALARVERFERRWPVRVSRVMAPPHGAFDRAMARRMVRVGFDALTISRAEPWLASSDRTQGVGDPSSGARPVSVEAGLPIVLRTHVERLATLPYSAFLRQPLVVYGHHWDWPAGAEALAETAVTVARLADVEWVPMAEVARWGTEATRSRDRVTLDVRSRLTRLDVPVDVTSVVVSPESVDERDSVLVGAVEIDPGEPMEVSPGASLVVELRPRDAVAVTADRRILRTSVAAGRRALTESRDRLAPATTRLRSMRKRREGGETSVQKPPTGSTGVS